MFNRFFWKMYLKFSIQMAGFVKSIRQKVFKVEYFWGFELKKRNYDLCSGFETSKNNFSLDSVSPP